MARTETHAKANAWKPWPLEAASQGMAMVVAAFTAWRTAAAGRRALADMTPDQLKDIGCPEPARPTLFLRVGLMTDLMSMR
ncbi:protein of unknown function [Mesorhizobium sp. NFR06]|nr:protein of unknown function [Mesorhizobium sp. NFR06]